MLKPIFLQFFRKTDFVVYKLLPKDDSNSAGLVVLVILVTHIFLST